MEQTGGDRDERLSPIADPEISQLIDRHPLSRVDPAECAAFVMTKGEFGPMHREELLAGDRLRIAGDSGRLLDLATVFLDAELPDRRGGRDRSRTLTTTTVVTYACSREISARADQLLPVRP